MMTTCTSPTVAYLELLPSRSLILTTSKAEWVMRKNQRAKRKTKKNLFYFFLTAIEEKSSTHSTIYNQGRFNYQVTFMLQRWLHINKKKVTQWYKFMPNHSSVTFLSSNNFRTCWNLHLPWQQSTASCCEALLSLLSLLLFLLHRALLLFNLRSAVPMDLIKIKWMDF